MNSKKTTCAVILAAGDGKRMNSDKPKVLMEVGEKTMLGRVIDSVEALSKKIEIGIIVGNGAEQVEDYLDTRNTKYTTFVQSERLGTGHAVKQATELIEKSDSVLVLCGDAPFMSAKIISDARDFHNKQNNLATVITAKIDDAASYGRIKRDKNGNLISIIEKKDCSPDELAINEVNSGAYWFDSPTILNILPKLKSNNAGGEYYLTDVIELVLKYGGKVGAFAAPDPDIILGANTPEELLKLNEIFKLKNIR